MGPRRALSPKAEPDINVKSCVIKTHKENRGSTRFIFAGGRLEHIFCFKFFYDYGVFFCMMVVGLLTFYKSVW